MSLPAYIGRYEVLGLLGTGGMAEVFLARIVGPSGFRRPVVIKKILPHLARQQSFVDMFLDEARIVARIHHANVVHVEELYQEGEELFIAMEYLEGESLDGIARRLAMHKRLLDYGVLAYIMAEICAGLHAAHELIDENGQSQNLVHRDVSPGNIFVTYDGHVKLLDFGIATAADRLASTQAGQVKGKYPYMSPEQLRGQPLDRRSDVFSLGTVLYEISTVRRLFKRATDLETAQAITKLEVTPPSHLIPGYPAPLEQICLRALEKTRDLRFQSALEMRRALIVFSRDNESAHTPEEMLASVMRKLFADRIDEKHAMLRRIAQGSMVNAVPTAEVDESVELQLAETSIAPREEASAKILTAETTGQRPSYRRGWLLGALAAAAIVIAGTALLTTGDSGSAGAVGGTTSSTSAAAKTPRRVIIDVQTEPPGANVSVAGEPRGVTPLSIALEASAKPARIEVVREGFAPIVQMIIPDRDQRVKVLMVRGGEDDTKKSKDPASKKPYRRFE